MKEGDSDSRVKKSTLREGKVANKILGKRMMKRSLRYDPHELRAPYQSTNRISSKTLDVMGLNKIDLD